MCEKAFQELKKRLFAPNKAKLKEEILNEAHRSKYSSIHLGSTKIYHNLKHQYWWQGMKRDVAKYVARCLNCQQVKTQHQKPTGLLQPLPLAEWKWDHITMDFVMGLLKTS